MRATRSTASRRERASRRRASRRRVALGARSRRSRSTSASARASARASGDPRARARGPRRAARRRAAPRRDRLRLVRGRPARRLPGVGVGAPARGRLPGRRREHARDAARRIADGLAALLDRPEQRDPRRHATPCRCATCSTPRTARFPATRLASVPHAVPFRLERPQRRAGRCDAPGLGRGARASPIPRLADDGLTARGRCILQHDRATLPCPRRGSRGPCSPSLAAGCGGSAVAVPELSSFTKVAQTSSAADSARFALEAQT